MIKVYISVSMYSTLDSRVEKTHLNSLVLQIKVIKEMPMEVVCICVIVCVCV